LFSELFRLNCFGVLRPCCRFVTNRKIFTRHILNCID